MNPELFAPYVQAINKYLNKIAVSLSMEFQQYVCILTLMPCFMALGMHRERYSNYMALDVPILLIRIRIILIREPIQQEDIGPRELFEPVPMNKEQYEKYMEHPDNSNIKGPTGL